MSARKAPSDSLRAVWQAPDDDGVRNGQHQRGQQGIGRASGHSWPAGPYHLLAARPACWTTPGRAPRPGSGTTRQRGRLSTRRTAMRLFSSPTSPSASLAARFACRACAWLTPWRHETKLWLARRFALTGHIVSLRAKSKPLIPIDRPRLNPPSTAVRGRDGHF
jgi:hypothetical protein